ncbi:MAG TPA: NTP transferase domain-containing protein [Acidimicrobiales bacterium]|nr:NTP transferase domain-containing protein [Acidimicrobiales bacterium]
MDLALVVMAAGLGSRFGGNKQLVEVGPTGEVFFDFAIADAVGAGATHVVLIVRREFERTVRDHIDARYGDAFRLSTVCQDEFGPQRVKPWGTAHAVLAVAEVVREPFLVVNADDYYGQKSYGLLAESLSVAPADTALLAAFRLGNTLPTEGTVSRGVCRVEGDRLASLVETHGIGRTRDGRIVSTDPVGEHHDDTPVSMNMWGFAPEIFGHLQRRWNGFYAKHKDDPKTEFLLPTTVAELRDEGLLDVRVVHTDDEWIGVTNPDDLEPARARLHALRS